MNQPTLPTNRAHDLPPRWDGRRVEWHGWTMPPPSSLQFHAPPDCCRACGSLEPQPFNRGTIWAKPGEAAPRHKPKTYAEAVTNRIKGSLMVFRCPDCRHDVVLGRSPGRSLEMWDLDESDYVDVGSWGR